MRNPGTRVGRPPHIPRMTAKIHATTGEKQGQAPMDKFDPAFPASGFNQPGGAMPFHHDDPAMCRGGKVKGR